MCNVICTVMFRRLLGGLYKLFLIEENGGGVEENL